MTHSFNVISIIALLLILSLTIFNSPTTNTKGWRLKQKRHSTLLPSQPQWWLNWFFFPLGTHRNIFMFILLQLTYYFLIPYTSLHLLIVQEKASKYCFRKQCWNRFTFTGKKKKRHRRAEGNILSFKTSIHQPPMQKAWFSEEKSWAPGFPFVTITMKN